MPDIDVTTLTGPIALVVDDEPLILMDTADMIADEGYEVVEASTADEAYAFLEKYSSLQLLFTDVQMPGDLDGFDLARKVAVRWPEICVIVASGNVKPKLGEIPVNARTKALHGMVPVKWIVETMQNEESKEGRSVHHHDVPAPNNWTLSWTRLGI